MLHFQTQGYNGTAVKYSPFFDNRIAVSSGSNFGLVGNGRLFVFELTTQGIMPMKRSVNSLECIPRRRSATTNGMQYTYFLINNSFTTQDTLFDLAWSELHENQVLTASGDGSIKLFDCTANEFPVQSWKEHGRETFSVNWNMVKKDTFCSSSWDGTVRVWSPHRPRSLLTLPTHSCTYSAAFSPHNPDILSAVSSDSHVRIFDLRTPASASNHLVLQIPNHGVGASTAQPGMPPRGAAPSEILTHDWNKYRQTVLATGGVDRVARTFDIRAPQQGPLAMMHGHQYAIRKLAWSPHLPNMLLTGGYDMTCRVWSDGSEAGAGDGDVMRAGPVGPVMGVELGEMGTHSEFVTGVDWCLFGSEGWAASVGWDANLYVWDVRNVIRH
ncbi:peroxisome biosynthesis protein (Peroxine-7) [Penicillium capsulatum]|uniref:Peroxin-7 n=1 Tax=Penicillium capsulatum TaxID=69766 RepID=A0A9W9I137_9EURO|nr:peroxisome biosynthesis protein (Peroxine-7) [Penicillium capsulatum]KAJ6117167.1 peroxisome biosynthesis protein (Peroxine-7) [Penicillium capsulatum]